MPTIRAMIRMLHADQGGRSAPVMGSYRPNHNFFSADNREMAVGLINLAPGDALVPGEERVLEVQFVSWPDGVEFTPGREWRIQEGAKLVGSGKIIGGI